MAEVEAVPPVEQTEAGDGQPEAPAAPVRREKLKKLPKPDKDAKLEQERMLQEQMDLAQKRIEVIKQEIQSKTGGRQSISKEQQAVRNKLNDLRAKFQAELAKKQQCRSDLENATKARDSVRAHLRDIKSKGNVFTSVDQIDEQIRRLEDDLQHNSHSLANEKKILEDIKKLRKSRGSVQQHNDSLDKLQADEGNRNKIVENLKACDDTLNKIKGEEEALRTQMAAIKAREEEHTADVPGLRDEIQECRAVIQAAWAKMREVRDAWKAANQEWYERDQAFRAQEHERKKAEYDQRQKAREEREAEKKARFAENAPEPFDEEVVLCEQLQSYLAKQVAADTAVAAVAAVQPAALDGMKIVTRKADKDELDGWFVGLGKGKGAKKGKAKAAAAADKPADRALRPHSFDIIEAFSKLKVEVPLTTAKVPAALESIKARREHYLEKRRKVKEGGNNDPEQEEEKEKGETSAEANGAKQPAAERKANGTVPHANGKPSAAAIKLNADEFPDLSPSTAARRESSPVGSTDTADDAPASEGDVSLELKVGAAGQKHDHVSAALTVSESNEVAVGEP